MKDGFLAATAAGNARSHLHKKDQPAPHSSHKYLMFFCNGGVSIYKINYIYLILILGSQDISHIFMSYEVICYEVVMLLQEDIPSSLSCSLPVPVPINLCIATH